MSVPPLPLPSEDSTSSGVRGVDLSRGAWRRELTGPTTVMPTGAGRRFVLLRLVGKGGFGEVYEARVETPGGLTRRIAVKLLRADMVDEDTMARTLDEAHLLSRLSHPSVVAVEDLIKVEDRLAIISEYVDGADLAECMPLKPAIALEIIAKVAEALHAAWSAPGPDGEPLRIVHRDLKPSNVRLGPHGIVKLLDFGIARPGSGPRRVQTGSGLLVGSLGYVAPERWNGTGEDHASDVYALGCVLLEALTDEPLFAGLPPVRQLALAGDHDSHAVHVAERIDAARPSRDMRELLVDMLAWNPEDRPSAMQVARLARRAANRLPGEGLLAWSASIEVGRSDWTTAEGTTLSETDRGFTVSTLRTQQATATAATVAARELDGELDEPASERGGGGTWLGVVAGLSSLLVLAVGSAVVAAVVAVLVWAAWPGASTEAQVADAGGAEPPGADVADVDPAPGSESGGAEPRGSEAPESEAPESEAPESEAPESEAPESGLPGSAAPPVGSAEPPAELAAVGRLTPARSSGEASDPGAAGVADPDPEPAPVEPAPAEPATTKARGRTTTAGGRADASPSGPSGLVRVLELSRVRLRAQDGSLQPIGAVPPGTYALEASWDIGTWRTEVPSLVVRPGQTLVYRCPQRFRRCVSEAP